MHRVELGKTGLEVNRFGFGGIPIQRVDEDRAVEAVFHAVEKGVDFIDTSRVYTTSERRIGLALKQTNKQVVLASKSRSRTSDEIRADLDVSLKELQREHIDLYQCHFVSNDEEYRQIVSPGGALEGLVRTKEEGVIGHIGITSHNLDLVEKILDDDLFETIMVCFSFLEPKAMETAIPKAFNKNVGVIAMKSLLEYMMKDTKEEQKAWGVVKQSRVMKKIAVSAFLKIILPIEAMIIIRFEDASKLKDRWKEAYGWLSASEQDGVQRLSQRIMKFEELRFQEKLENAAFGLIEESF